MPMDALAGANMVGCRPLEPFVVLDHPVSTADALAKDVSELYWQKDEIRFRPDSPTGTARAHPERGHRRRCTGQAWARPIWRAARGTDRCTTGLRHFGGGKRKIMVLRQTRSGHIEDSSAVTPGFFAIVTSLSCKKPVKSS